MALQGRVRFIYAYGRENVLKKTQAVPNQKQTPNLEIGNLNKSCTTP